MVPVTPKMLTPFLTFAAVRSLSPAMVNSENTLPDGGRTVPPAAVGVKEPGTSGLAGCAVPVVSPAEVTAFLPKRMSSAVAVALLTA